jgi:hypothetical protein
MAPKPRVYKTPDGKEFTNKAEWRDYMMATFYSFKNVKGEKPAPKMPGTIDGQMFDIADCEDAELVVMDHCEQVQIDEVKNSRVFVGACESSMFIRNCTGCTFYVACRQLRLREVTNCTFYCFSTAEVHIEYSNTVRFAPFNGGYPEQAQHLTAGKLPVDHNLWYDIFDHNDPGKTGANWSLLPEAEYETGWFPVGECERAIPLTKQGSVMRVDGDTTGDGGKEGMQSFSLQTSAEQAQAAVEAAEESEAPVQEHVVTAEAAADMEAGMSVVDCITAFGNYIPGATNLMDVCTSECEIILDSGFPVNMGEFKEKAGPTMLQEIEKNASSADGSLAWATFWCSNVVTNELFSVTAVLERQKNKGYKMCALHRGVGVTEDDLGA